MNISKEVLVQQYAILSNSQTDKNLRDQANYYIMNFQKTKEAWAISRELLLSFDTPELQFIGAQVISGDNINKFNNKITFYFFFYILITKNL